MKITMIATGGMPGIPMCEEIDTLRLSAKKAQKLRKNIYQSRVMDTPPMPDDNLPDVCKYIIKMEHEIRFTDATMPPSLRPLMDLLQELGDGKEALKT